MKFQVFKSNILCCKYKKKVLPTTLQIKCRQNDCIKKFFLPDQVRELTSDPQFSNGTQSLPLYFYLFFKSEKQFSKICLKQNSIKFMVRLLWLIASSRSCTCDKEKLNPSASSACLAFQELCIKGILSKLRASTWGRVGKVIKCLSKSK